MSGIRAALRLRRDVEYEYSPQNTFLRFARINGRSPLVFLHTVNLLYTQLRCFTPRGRKLHVSLIPTLCPEKFTLSKIVGPYYLSGWSRAESRLRADRFSETPAVASR